MTILQIIAFLLSNKELIAEIIAEIKDLFDGDDGDKIKTKLLEAKRTQGRSPLLEAALQKERKLRRR